MKVLNVKGPIISNDSKWIYDLFDMDSTAPKDILNELDGQDIQLDINSNGGLVTAGNEIYSALLAYQGKVTVNVVGMAASAASIIAMAGNVVRMSPVAQIMIHNVSAVGEGDYHDMDDMSSMLQLMNDSLSNAYTAKTGMTKDDVLALMDKTTFLTAEQAVENGFADEIIQADNNLQLVASIDTFIPDKLINAFKELKQENEELKKPHATINIDAEAIADSIMKKIKTQKEEPTVQNGFSRFLF
ncbi:MAG: Clp protease ClpP [Liquorilactobacillus nagelii]|jgi:ATP-dependent Clp protease protease subunit|uniref:head maturation protease, ClpP-related n=1 Tax=Liquorilactobacillus nagelii TaxID=82688 RepID=UPI00242E4DA7|nr:head maturation protease, ClpP-related [Liquorilactobacillus nagelii]MCI1920478.1 Clp protease ClpP [Liquorilactobacillus nagelii]MCI1976122.1 Clp protease ClpP [Liquorilactobacillus nagelii]